MGTHTPLSFRHVLGGQTHPSSQSGIQIVSSGTHLVGPQGDAHALGI